MTTPNFQVTIVSAAPPAAAASHRNESLDVQRHGGAAGKVIERIEALEGIWDRVVEKLTGLAEKSQIAATASKFELGSIEFNIGIEAGLNVGLVTKGEASVTITFERKHAAK